MPRLGNVSVSALLSASAGALARQQTYDDATAAYEYSISAKTNQDYAKYASYLGARAKTQIDPAKQLALQKTADTARTQYQSAQITRINTQINYGNMSLQDKSNALQALHSQAVSIGDMDQAQNLEMQYTTVDKQIQNEAIAAAKANAPKLGGYDTGLGKGYADKLALFDEADKQLKQKLATGEITATQFAAGMSAINGGSVSADGTQIPGREQVYAALNKDQTGLSEADQQKLYDKYSAFVSGADYKQYNSYTGSLLKSGDIGFANKQTQTGVDAAGKPVYTSEIVPLKKVGSQLDANGNQIPQYETGRKAGDNSTFIRNVKTGGGLGKEATNLYNVPGEDGYGYITDPQGKRFVGKTITLPSGKQGEFTAKDLGTLKDLESNKPNVGGGGFNIDQYMSDFKNVPRDVAGAVNTLKPAVGKALKGLGAATNALNVPGALNKLFNGDAAKRGQEQEAQALAAAQARNAVLVTERARQSALLPVFQSPATKAAAAPKPVTPLSFAPLPGQTGYVNAVDKTKATIANPNSTARDALKSLVGF